MAICNDFVIFATLIVMAFSPFRTYNQCRKPGDAHRRVGALLAHTWCSRDRGVGRQHGANAAAGLWGEAWDPMIA